MYLSSFSRKAKKIEASEYLSYMQARDFVPSSPMSRVSLCGYCDEASVNAADTCPHCGVELIAGYYLAGMLNDEFIFIKYV